MNTDTPDPAKDDDTGRQELLKGQQAHQRATREANQALLRKAAQDPAGFIADLQKQVDNLGKP